MDELNMNMNMFTVKNRPKKKTKKIAETNEIEILGAITCNERKTDV